MSAVPVVELRAASRTYSGPPEVTVLRPTTLVIGAGDQVAVVGPSGSGKSTLLAILGTLDEPSDGAVLVDGAEVTGMRERDRSRLRAERIGFVFQQFHLLPALTAAENVATGLLYSGVRHAERLRRAAASAFGQADCAAERRAEKPCAPRKRLRASAADRATPALAGSSVMAIDRILRADRCPARCADQFVLSAA